MDKIEFKFDFTKNQFGLFVSANIFINDIDLLEIIKDIDEDGRIYDNHEGIGLEDLCNILYYKNHEEHYQDGRITILGCICGDIDCGPFKVRLEETPYSIIWEDFHGRKGTMDPLIYKFEFEKNQYNEQTENLSKMVKSRSVIKMDIDLKKFELKKRQLN